MEPARISFGPLESCNDSINNYSARLGRRENHAHRPANEMLTLAGRTGAAWTVRAKHRHDNWTRVMPEWCRCWPARALDLMWLAHAGRGRAKRLRAARR